MATERDSQGGKKNCFIRASKRLRMSRNYDGRV